VANLCADTWKYYTNNIAMVIFIDKNINYGNYWINWWKLKTKHIIYMKCNNSIIDWLLSILLNSIQKIVGICRYYNWSFYLFFTTYRIVYKLYQYEMYKALIILYYPATILLYFSPFYKCAYTLNYSHHTSSRIYYYNDILPI